LRIWEEIVTPKLKIFSFINMILSLEVMWNTSWTWFWRTRKTNIIAKLKKNSTPKGKYNIFRKFIFIVLQGNIQSCLQVSLAGKLLYMVLFEVDGKYSLGSLPYLSFSSIWWESWKTERKKRREWKSAK
jgi:hypothetical protein